MTVWKYIENLNDDGLTRSYWKNVHICAYHGTDEEVHYAINKLVEYGRFSSAFKFAYIISERIGTELLYTTSMGVVTINKEDYFPTHYEMEKVLKELNQRTDIERGDLATLELMTIPLINEKRYTPINLYKELASNPESFIEIIKMVAHEEKEDDRDKNESLKQYKFRIGYTVLRDFNIIPGTQEDGTIDEDHLNAWIDEVRTFAQQIDKEGLVDDFIGEVLASPAQEEVNYPNPIICRVLERLDSDSVNDGFHSRIFNSQGVTVREPLSGGWIERDKASFLKGIAEKHRNSFPAISKIFEGLARSYESMASHEDQRAKMESMEY